MKKIIFFSLVLTLMLISAPSVLASSYGKVTDITKAAGDSLTSGSGTLETKGDTTTITYKTSTFKILDEDKNATDGQRPGPAAWIGFEITEPTDDNNSSFKVTTPDNQTTQIKKKSYRDYVGITTSNLKNALLKGTNLTYKYSFDWNEDGSANQYVIIEVDPEAVSLISKTGETVWSPDIAKDILAEQNPDTSDINLFLIIGLFIAASFGLIYYFKKA